MAYYHPRTGSETTPSVDYARVLESTSREVRRIVAAETEAPILPAGVATLYDLLMRVLLNPDIPVTQILSLRASNTVRELPPQTFEGMWKIVFALGLVPGYETARLYKGKVEGTLVRVKKSKILDYLEGARLATSSESGASDITLGFHEEPETSECSTPDKEASAKKMFLFCSSKFYTSDRAKTVDSYDVANIIAAANYAGYSDDQFRIVLLVKNKEIVKGKFATAYRRYLTYIVVPDGSRDGVLGREDLEAAVVRLRERVQGQSNPRTFLQTVLLGGEGVPRFLSLRFHQELIVRKTLEIKATHSSVLWGVVARGGKTYICGGLIRDMVPKAKYIFIVAGAYTETHTQFLDELLDVRKQGFRDFAEYTTVNVRDEEFTFDADKKYIFFISAELLKAFVEGKTGKKARERKVMTYVQEGRIVPDLVFFDEVHKGGTTSLADDALSLIAGKAFKVFMTATYNKLFIKDEYGITQDNFLTWGYEDIQAAKGLESTEVVETFAKRYGKALCDDVIASQVARGNSLADIAREYQKFPEIQFLTTTFSTAFQTSMQKQNILDPTAGFRMNTLLATDAGCMDLPIKKRHRCLTNPASVGVLLNYIAPHTSQMETIGADSVAQVADPAENIMTRIGRTSQRRGDILRNVHTEFRPHSQLWFLPQPTVGTDDTPLMSRMTAFGSLILKHPWFGQHFCVVAVSSGFGRTEITYYEKEGRVKGAFIATTNGESNTKQTILDLEAKAYAMDRGLLILAGKMLTLGVSLPCVNVVALLDDSQSSDLTYQKMFRALTESEGKKIGYIIDVNPVRTLKTIYDYTKVEHDATDDAKVDATVLTNLYLIDEDQLFVLDKEKRVTPLELNKAVEGYLLAGRKTYKSIVDEASVKLATVDLTSELQTLRNDLHAVSSQALGVVSRLAGDAVPSGVEVIKPDAKPPAAPKPAKDDTQEKLQALREMILTTMTLLAFLTTFPTFAEAFEYYKADTDNIQHIIHSVLVDRGLTTMESKTKIRDALLLAIQKVQPQLTSPYGKMRTKLSDLSGDQKEVVEFIEQNLRPKREQVASRGEVFTPLPLVEDMLNHLPDDVWTHPEYKWLDPSNGIGNFPVIAFTKLDAGLRTVEGYTDDTVRHKHIVETMLYMVELDDANVRLSRRLLEKMCGSPNCKINLLKHDFLTATDSVLLDAFGVNRFHVIMGNPPYNVGGVVKGGGTIWPKFVKRSFELITPGGYITFVHPPGWRKFNDPDDRENQGVLWRTVRANNWSLRYINVSDEARFVSTKVVTDYYVIQASPSTDPTAYTSRFGILQNEGAVAIDLPFIPNLINPETMQIIKKLFALKGTPIQIVRNQSFQPTEADKRKPGIPHYRYTTAKGERAIYYKEYATVPDYITKPKVLMTYSSVTKGQLFAFYSEETLGTADNSMYMLTSSPEEGARLVEFFNSDVITFLMKITQYSEPPNNKNEFKILNQIKLPASLSDLRLTPEELRVIETVVRPAKVVPQTRTTRRSRNSTSPPTRRKGRKTDL